MTSEKLAESQNIISDCTVIVLAKNHEQYLSDCLGSIHRELSGVKILCADVGSGDKSFEKGKEIPSTLNLNSIHIQLGEGTKTLTTLKKLEQYIDTKYVVLLSADDALGDNYGTALIDILKQTPNYSVINFVSMVSGQDLNPLFPKSPKWADKIQKNKRLLSYSNPGTAPGAVIPWEILIKSPSWKQPPNILIEDYWLWWQLIDQVPFINCKESHVLYRQHENNVTKDTKNKDYAYSLGYVSTLPNIKALNFLNKLLSIFLILRWIRHLNVCVWKNYAAGYISAIRNEVD